MLILMGRSCTGKDSIFKELIKNYDYNGIITYTNRPMRIGEVQDVDYHFISTEEFLKRNIDNKFLESRYYYTKEGMWFYGSDLEDLKNSNYNNIIIMTPDGAKKVFDAKIKCTIILIDVDDDEILKRQIIRGDEPSEAKRRFETDKRDFKDSHNISDFIVLNDKDIKEVAKEIDSIHKNWRIQE